MSDILVETKDLTKYFRRPHGLLHAVDGVSIQIKKGETLGIVGESGCGKSTLGRVIMRLVDATEGEVFFHGENILNYNKHEMKKIRTEMQMIFQDPFASLNPRHSIGQIVSEPIEVIGNIKGKRKIEEKTRNVLDLCGLPKRYYNTYPHELDGGRRQRVGLARALSVDPSFIVCDEPVSALDVSIQAQMLNLLMDLQEQRGLAYMFITHDLCVVRHISTYIAVMYLGQVVEYATKKELFLNNLHPYTKALLSAIPTIDMTKRNKEKYLLEGEVSDPIDPAPGCRFISRCRYACKRCKEPQSLREIASGHFVRCILADK